MKYLVPYLQWDGKLVSHDQLVLKYVQQTNLFANGKEYFVCHIAYDIWCISDVNRDSIVYFLHNIARIKLSTP